MASVKLINFIKDIQQYDNVIDIIDDYNDQRSKGFIYERLWDIIIKFGFCEKFPKSKYIHYVGQVNTNNLKELKNIKKYVEKTNVISGNSGGCSDITLKNRETNEFIFISCKYPKLVLFDLGYIISFLIS